MREKTNAARPGWRRSDWRALYQLARRIAHGRIVMIEALASVSGYATMRRGFWGMFLFALNATDAAHLWDSFTPRITGLPKDKKL